eukprot:g7688.t1
MVLDFSRQREPRNSSYTSISKIETLGGNDKFRYKKARRDKFSYAAVHQTRPGGERSRSHTKSSKRSHNSDYFSFLPLSFSFESLQINYENRAQGRSSRESVVGPTKLFNDNQAERLGNNKYSKTSNAQISHRKPAIFGNERKIYSCSNRNPDYFSSLPLTFSFKSLQINSVTKEKQPVTPPTSKKLPNTPKETRSSEHDVRPKKLFNDDQLKQLRNNEHPVKSNAQKNSKKAARTPTTHTFRVFGDDPPNNNLPQSYDSIDKSLHLNVHSRYAGSSGRDSSKGFYGNREKVLRYNKDGKELILIPRLDGYREKSGSKKNGTNSCHIEDPNSDNTLIIIHDLKLTAEEAATRALIMVQNDNQIIKSRNKKYGNVFKKSHPKHDRCDDRTIELMIEKTFKEIWANGKNNPQSVNLKDLATKFNKTKKNKEGKAPTADQWNQLLFKLESKVAGYHRNFGTGPQAISDLWDKALKYIKIPDANGKAIPVTSIFDPASLKYTNDFEKSMTKKEKEYFEDLVKKASEDVKKSIKKQRKEKKEKEKKERKKRQEKRRKERQKNSNRSTCSDRRGNGLPRKSKPNATRSRRNQPRRNTQPRNTTSWTQPQHFNTSWTQPKQSSNFGDISAATGRRKETYVRPYTKANGTHVDGHWRS